MKKKQILMLATGIATSMFLSRAHAQITIAPEAGLNLANASVATNSPLGTPGTGIKPGLKAGAIVEIPVTAGFFIQPGVFYSQKGSQSSLLIIGPLGAVEVGGKLVLNTIEVPLNLGYRYRVGKAGSLFVTAGPYLGYTFSGKNRIDGKVATVVGSPLVGLDEDVRFGSKETEMKAVDIGLNFSAGYQLPLGIYARVQYGLGLSNLYNASGTSFKNRVLAFSLGYAFRLSKA